MSNYCPEMTVNKRVYRREIELAEDSLTSLNDGLKGLAVQAQHNFQPEGFQLLHTSSFAIRRIRLSPSNCAIL